jgi:hypothetical protein
MRIFYNNLIDAAAASVIGYSSQATNFPAENLRDPQRSKPWRMGTSAGVEYVTFDLGSAMDVSHVILLDHTIESSVVVTLEGNTSNTWGAPAFSQVVSLVIYDTLAITALTSPPRTYRYWRLTIDKGLGTDAFEIGRVFLGTYYDPTDPPDFDGFTRSAVDLSLKTRTPYGAVFGDTRPQYRRLRFDFTRIPDAQKVQLATIAGTVGTVTPFFVQVDDSAADELGEPVYVVHRDVPDFEVAGYDGESKWNTRLDLEEVL